MKDKTNILFGFDSYSEYHNLINYYYSIFMARYKIGNASDDESNFILRKLWANGRISSFHFIENEEINIVGFAQFEVNGFYNYLDVPVKARPISTREDADRLFPKAFLTVGKDIILGYAQNNQKSIREYVEHIARKMVVIEKAMRRNIKALSVPIAAGASTENKTKMNEFFNKLDSDTDKLFFEFSEGVDKPYLLWNNVPNNLASFYNQIQSYHSEILTYLGINNLGSSEKKEHLITSEVDVNNEMIKLSNDNFTRNIESFLNRTNEAFGTNYTLIVNKPEVVEDDETD